MPFFLFALLTVLMTYPLLLHLGDHLPSDLGDPLHHVWLIGRNLATIKQGFSHFWDAAIFYPHQKTLLYGDYVPALTLIAALPALFTNNLVVVYNLLWLFSFFLAALSAYFLVFHFTASAAAGFLAGLIFAFSPLRFAHISHLELLFSSWLPLCFLFLHRYIEKPTWRRLSLALIFLIIQALTCGHYGLYAGLFMGLFGLGLAFSAGLWKKPGFWLRTVAGVILAGLILLPFFLPYFSVHKKMGFSWPYGDIKYYSAQIQHYLAVPSWNQTWGKVLKTQDIPEHQVFLGFTPFLILVGWLVLNWNKPGNEGYRPYFFNWLLAWFNWKKKAGGKGKTLALGLLCLDSIIFILFLDIFIILAAGGFHVHWGNIHFSSRRLVNPLLFLVLLCLVRIAVHPGWKQVLQKLNGFLAVVLNKKTNYRQSFASAEEFLPRRHVIYDLYFTMAILSWLLSLGPEITLNGKKILTGPYALFWRWVPGFQAMRVPSRFSVMVVLALSTLSGLALTSFLKARRRVFSGRGLIILLAGLIILEEVSFPLPLASLPGKGKLPPVYNYLASEPADSALLELPLPAGRRFYYQEALPMYYSLFHGLRIVNGYSGFIPPAYSIIQEAMESFPSEETVALLKKLKVSFILVHTEGYRPEKGKEIVTRLGSWPEDFVLVAQNEADFLYKTCFDSIRTALNGPEKTRREMTTGITRPVPQPPLNTPIKDKENWLTWASSNVTMASKAVDGSRDTGWSTVGRQRRGDFFWVDFGREVVLTEVRLYLKNKIFDYPRFFVVEGSSDRKHWKKIKECENAFPYLDLKTIESFADYYVRLNFPPAQVKFLRLRLTRPHPVYHWSIQEFECFGREREEGQK